ncbi:MAG: beta-galactosidase trimerization domain-containing protein [Kiritimatiellae bacterium]|nr:beta-galactosidase trimerization domain-containing protein [Kiritimatiellia bacterium]
MMKCLCGAVSVCLAGVLTVAAEEGCRITQSTVDGVKQILLENGYVRLQFVPARGGVCTSFLDKRTGTEWTTPKSGGGMFEDHIWQQSYRQGDFHTAAYVPKIVADSPERVVLELAGQGRTGDNQFNTFKKSVSLARGSAAVRVHYEFDVGHDAMSEKTIGLWFHHSIAVPNQKVAYYYPLEAGVKTLLYDPAMPPEEYWEYNPTRGWVGAVTGKGAGLGCGMEYKRLMCFYQWFGQSLATLEWMFRNETIPNGESVKTDIVFHPFADLKSVAGVGAGGVASLDVPPAGAAGRPLAARAAVALSDPVQKGRVEWSLRRLPDLLWAPFKTDSLSTAEPKTLMLDASFTPETDGLYAVQVKVTDGDAVLVEAEKPVTVGQAKEPYALAPPEKRIGNPDDRFGQRAYKKADVDLPLTFKVATEHVPWAKPYYKGKVNALFLVHGHNAREVVELAQRMDLDFEAPLIDFGDPAYVGDVYGKIRPAILNDMLKKALSKDGYDVIVISGLNFKRLDEGLPDLLKKQIEKGVGLVFIAPWNRNMREGAVYDMLPLDIAKNPTPFRDGGEWQVAADHPVTRGVPVDALPQTGFFGHAPDAVKPGARVFLNARRGSKTYPLGILSEQGRQRTVVFAYRTSRIMAGHGDCLTPFIRYPRERFRYWEYHHGLLANAILWTAHKEPEVVLEQAVEPAQPAFGQSPVTVRVKAAGAGASALGSSTLELTLRDAWWRVVQAGSFTLDPRAGRAEIAMPITRPLPVGTYFADSILRGQGKSVAWGTLAFRVAGAEHIARVKLPQTINVFKTGDSAAVSVEVANAGPGATLTAMLEDGHGREVAARDYPVAPGASAKVDVSFAVEHPLSTEGRIRVLLKRAGQVIDEADADFATLPDRFASRVWDDYEIIPWGSLGAYNQGYLIPAMAKACKEGGISVLYPNGGWTGDEDLRNEHESSLRAGFRTIAVGLWGRGSYPKDYEGDRRKYQETGDKKYLERRPSLSDPAYKKEMIESVRKKVDLFKRFSPLGWMWGDEQSVIGRIPVFDYDWSAPALAEFRQWLAAQYGSLDALNKEWRTSYAAWDEVLPLTGSEARKQKNYAPWADHRTFMERSYAGFFAMLDKALKDVFPDSKTGLSGTQVPSPYNGIDWSQFMKIFTYMQPYYNEGQAEMMVAFAPGVPRARWNGYGSTRQGPGTWADFLQGDMGRSFFALRSYVNPDFTLTRSGKDMGDSTERLRKGLGRLWSGVRPDFDPIGILYSQRSIQGGYLAGKDWWRSHQAWFKALYSLGYNPRFVPYEELEQGHVTPDRYRVLILPMTFCVSRQQAARIQEYANAGGSVLADCLVGAMDGHCQIAQPGMLDALFGIRRTGFREKEKPQGQLAFRPGAAVGIDLAGLSNTTTLPDADLALAGGTALGDLAGVPYAVFHRAGRGKTGYLNIDMTTYLAIAGQPAGEFYREIVRRLIVWAGAGAPAVAVGAPDFDGRIFRQREGNNFYVGYLRPREADQDWTVRFAGPPRHVYDMLAGKYHGKVTQAPSMKSGNYADLFALLPYKVTGMSVTPAAQRAKPGQRVPIAVALATEGGSPSRHAARVTVTSPKGEEVNCYSMNLALPAGKGTFDLPFALNDLPGTWRVDVRDVVTGTTGTTTLELGG